MKTHKDTNDWRMGRPPELFSRTVATAGRESNHKLSLLRNLESSGWEKSFTADFTDDTDGFQTGILALTVRAMNLERPSMCR